MPAVAVAVVTRDQVLDELVHGVADLSTGRPATEEDWWDLASLTKTVVTLPEVLDLVAQGRIHLDDRSGGLALGSTAIPGRGRLDRPAAQLRRRPAGHAPNSSPSYPVVTPSCGRRCTHRWSVPWARVRSTAT